MQLMGLKSAKKMFFVCLLLFAVMVYLGNANSSPVLLKGVVQGVLEQDGTERAVALDVDGTRYVVKFTGQYLLTHMPPKLGKNQEVALKATKFQAVKQGITCEFVELVAAGPIPADSAPEGDEPLPVDDLKPALGYKGM